jgi:hypothetical protein
VPPNHKFSQFPLIFNYRENFAEVRFASFLLRKGLLKSFGRSVEIWCDFLNVAILVFLGAGRWTIFDAARLRVRAFNES